MRITKPDYFDRFRCLAGSCPDSCCKEWEVQVERKHTAKLSTGTGKECTGNQAGKNGGNRRSESESGALRKPL